MEPASQAQARIALGLPFGVRTGPIRRGKGAGRLRLDASWHTFFHLRILRRVSVLLAVTFVPTRKIVEMSPPHQRSGDRSCETGSPDHQRILRHETNLSSRRILLTFAIYTVLSS